MTTVIMERHVEDQEVEVTGEAEAGTMVMGTTITTMAKTTTTTTANRDMMVGIITTTKITTIITTTMIPATMRIGMVRAMTSHKQVVIGMRTGIASNITMTITRITMRNRARARTSPSSRHNNPQL